MRRVITLFLIVLFVFAAPSAYAHVGLQNGGIKLPSETAPLKNIKSHIDGSFDYTVLQDLAGYHYDESEKRWTYDAAYIQTFADAYIILDLELFGEENGSNLKDAVFWAKTVDKEGNQIETVKSIRFIIDGATYSYAYMGNPRGALPLYEKGYDLVKALSDANTVTVELDYKSGSYIELELDKTGFSQTIQELCKNVVKYKIWDYYIANSATESWEAMCFPNFPEN